MCTAVFKNFFLSRTVDRVGRIDEHRIIGKENYVAGVIRNDYGEIWIDGMNKHGLMTALLNHRKELTNECSCGKNRIKLHPGKIVLHLLENCRNTREASEAVLSLKLTSDEPEMYPHFIIADKSGECIVFEGGKVYENKPGVLANAPSFPEQIKLCSTNMANENEFYSSESRFRRMSWLSKRTKTESVSDCFDMLTVVAVPEGADHRPGYRTVLRSVMSADSMTYSYAAGCSGKIQSVSVGSEFDISLKDD